MLHGLGTGRTGDGHHVVHHPPHEEARGDVHAHRAKRGALVPGLDPVNLRHTARHCAISALSEGQEDVWK
jgi:hypothetical protein